MSAKGALPEKAFCKTVFSRVSLLWELGGGWKCKYKAETLLLALIYEMKVTIKVHFMETEILNTDSSSVLKEK